jgi:hypothetical protein
MNFDVIISSVANIKHITQLSTMKLKNKQHFCKSFLFVKTGSYVNGSAQDVAAQAPDII